MMLQFFTTGNDDNLFVFVDDGGGGGDNKTNDPVSVLPSQEAIARRARNNVKGK